MRGARCIASPVCSPCWSYLIPCQQPSLTAPNAMIDTPATLQSEPACLALTTAHPANAWQRCVRWWVVQPAIQGSSPTRQLKDGMSASLRVSGDCSKRSLSSLVKKGFSSRNKKSSRAEAEWLWVKSMNEFIILRNHKKKLVVMIKRIQKIFCSTKALDKRSEMISYVCFQKIMI